MSNFDYIQAIGQDSHRFLSDDEQRSMPERALMLGGVLLPGEKALKGNSDADVILHAITNAISGLTGQIVLGPLADGMCRMGITDSVEYLKRAQMGLGKIEIRHVSLAVECLRPKLLPWINPIRNSVANILGIPFESVTMTATTGEGLTSFGRGEGIQVFCVVSARKPAVDNSGSNTFIGGLFGV